MPSRQAMVHYYCHVGDEAGQGQHQIKKTTVTATYKPVALVAAENLLRVSLQLGEGEALEVEPYVHPDFNCAYATAKYVLVAAPGKLPLDRAGVVVLCSRHHQNAAYTSQGLRHNTPAASKARKAAAEQQQQPPPPPPLPAAAESGPRTGAHGQAGTSTRSAEERAQDPIMQALSKRALVLAAEVAEARAATDASQVRVYVRAGCGLGFGRLHAKWVCSIAGTLTCIPGANRTGRSNHPGDVGAGAGARRGAGGGEGSESGFSGTPPPHPFDSHIPLRRVLTTCARRAAHRQHAHSIHIRRKAPWTACSARSPTPTATSRVWHTCSTPQNRFSATLGSHVTTRGGPFLCRTCASQSGLLHSATWGKRL
jgi:hypothetical protein